MIWCVGTLFAASFFVGGCSGPQKIEPSQFQTEADTETESSAVETAAQDSSMVQETAQESTAVSEKNGNCEEKRIVPLPATLSVDNLKKCTPHSRYFSDELGVQKNAQEHKHMFAI